MSPQLFSQNTRLSGTGQDTEPLFWQAPLGLRQCGTLVRPSPRLRVTARLFFAYLSELPSRTLPVKAFDFVTAKLAKIANNSGKFSSQALLCVLCGLSSGTLR